jgi:hypothetical protein
LRIVLVCKSKVANCACACTILSLLATPVFSIASACLIKAKTCSSVAPVAVFVRCLSLSVILWYSDKESAHFFIW